ncbi:MAG: hypothetical protein AB1631_32905 [Acidobacteriota bacterium]
MSLLAGQRRLEAFVIVMRTRGGWMPVATNTYAEIRNARFFPSAVSDDSEAQETRSLLNRLAEGDREAFWPLWEQHKNISTLYASTR